jgi:hypothetical protein
VRPVPTGVRGERDGTVATSVVPMSAGQDAGRCHIR